MATVVLQGKFLGVNRNQYTAKDGSAKDFGSVLLFDSEGVDVIKADSSDTLSPAALVESFKGVAFGQLVTIKCDIRAFDRDVRYRIVQVVAIEKAAA